MKLITVLFLGLLPILSEAQVRPIPPIIKKLRSINEAVVIFQDRQITWVNITDLPPTFDSETQHLVKTSEGIYVTVPGTGRLYKAVFKGDQMDFIRIDSTYFMGYNFNALSFAVDSTIFSFGGEGYWHVNGNFRYYNFSGNEWHAIRLNRTIHQSFNYRSKDELSFVDVKRKHLFINGCNSADEYVKEYQKDSLEYKQLYRLDLQTNDWHSIGRRVANLELGHIAALPQGLLTQQFVYDLQGNKVYRHKKNDVILSVIGLYRFYRPHIISFAVDSVVYLGNSFNRIDSFVVSQADLVDTGEVIYEVEEKTSYSWLYLALTGLGMAVCLFYLQKLLRRKSAPMIMEQEVTEVVTTMPDSTTPPVLRSGRLTSILTVQQLDFLHKLFQNSSEGRTTTIDEINRTLGTHAKSVEIQKKLRSDVINGINDRLALGLGIKTPLIDKQRSEFDKRSFEYFVNPEHMELVRDVLQNRVD